MPDLKIPKNPKTYECEICNYITANKKDFNKHNLTRKHLTLTLKLTDKSIDQSIVYTCNCGKPYKHRQSLFSHKKTCTKMNSESFPSEASCNQRNGLPTGATDSTDLNENSHSTTYRSVNADEISNIMVGTNQFSNELLYNLLKEIAVSNAKNDELKNMVIKQTTTNDELKNMFIKQNEQLIQQNAQLMELANKPSTINNNTTMNKPKFNLNLFLNEECKNAMNWLEFAELVKSKICFADLEYMGKHGYVAGQSKIIKDNLQNIEVNKRPFHCTDLKRKTVHIKDQDEWKREEGHSTTLTKLVNKIEHTENVVLYDWIQTKPDCYKHNSPDNQTYMDIATAITKHAHEDNQDKALVEVLQNVMVEKK